MKRIYAELPKRDTTFIGWQAGEFFVLMTLMILVHALVFFISITAEPTQPGPNKAGMLMTWVLYGAPSEQKAREWAQAKYDAYQLKSDVPKTIKEFLVLPMGDTLCTEKGPEPVQWTSLPSLEQRAIPGPGLVHYDSSLERELHGSSLVFAPNKMHGKDDRTPDQIRASQQSQIKDSADWNWDEDRAWYFIFYTRKQAVLVQAVNSIAAAISYSKAVRGTPTGDENARIRVWQELTKYND